MAYKHFRPKPGRFGVQLVIASSAFIGTGGTALTANTTTTVRFHTPFRRCWIERISLSIAAAGADADGTILATVKKRDNVNAANVSLTAATSLEADFVTASNTTYLVPLLSTLTDAQQTLQEGDFLYVDIVNNSAAIDTQPSYANFVVELAVLE